MPWEDPLTAQMFVEARQLAASGDAAISINWVWVAVATVVLLFWLLRGKPVSA